MKVARCFLVAIVLTGLLVFCKDTETGDIDGMIKAYCLDFNWGKGGPNAFAEPGLWADADTAEHVKWYNDMGANTIQTFCVLCNGYAWYENGVVPPQPGLKHDFLTDVVRLEHEKGMKVIGYFCIVATNWSISFISG